eukprot:1262224-Pyramimonas_sp.AAC.1
MAANVSDKRDAWERQGQSLKRCHYVPRLVTFMPAVGHCLVELNKLDDKRRTCAVNPQQGLAMDRTGNWRDEESRHHHPSEYDLDGDSSD